MCGIVGYVGSRQATPIVFEGLKRLEYRGYDSAGIAVIQDGQIADPPRGRQAGQPGTALGSQADGGPDRHRPHPLGHPRQTLADQRPPPPGLHRPGRRHPERHRRELSLAAPGTQGRGPSLFVRDRHRGDRPPGRTLFGPGTRPGNGRPERAAAASRAPMPSW